MKIKTSFHPDPQMIKQAGVSSSMSAFHEKLACVNVDIPEKTMVLGQLPSFLLIMKTMLLLSKETKKRMKQRTILSK